MSMATTAASADLDRQQVNFRLPKAKYRNIRMAAARDGLSTGQWLEMAVDQLLLQQRDAVAKALREEAERAAEAAQLWEQELGALAKSNENKIREAKDESSASDETEVSNRN